MEDMNFTSERDLECYVRTLIRDHVTSRRKNIYALESKKVVDIVICRDGKTPGLFFLEIKYYKKRYGRLALGGGVGKGFQPEIVRKKPRYFEKHLRWILATEEYPEAGILLVDSATIRQFAAGRELAKKHNNI